MAVATISGAIKWTGLASDTDFGKVVQQLVAIERRTITRQETWKSEWLKKLTAINGLDTRLSAVKLDAQSFNTREKLLSRTAVSSDEKVVSLTNLSTAPAGVYDVEVGADIRERIASGSYKANQPIGVTFRKDAGGAILNADGKPALLPWVTEDGYDSHLDDDGAILDADGNPVLLPGVTAGVDYDHLDADGYPVDAAGQRLTELLCYLDDDGYPVDADGERLPELLCYVSNDSFGLLSDYQDRPIVNKNHPDFDHTDINGYPFDSDDNLLGDAFMPFPPGFEPQPLTITMGGKTLTLNYTNIIDFNTNKPTGVYSGGMTMEQLAKAINDTVAEAGYAGPNVTAGVIFDKTRDGETYSRLIITGGEGGSANHITISDPTNLGLDKKHFDEPVTAGLVGTSARPKIAADSVYTGCSNKTFTFVSTNSGVLGEKDIIIAWADTEGNQGKFTLAASDWDPVEGRLKEDVEIIQGLKLNFDFGAQGNFMANEAFTIDCQVPVMQQAADSGLAASDKWIHQGWSDLTSPVTFGAAGRFDFSYAGENYSVPIADGLGLSGLADAINNYSKNPGVIASVINDGLGTATSYKLVLTGAHTGMEHGIEVLSTTSLNRLDCSPDKFEHARYAANSMSRFDGYPNDGVTWLQRQTNEVGDVIDGTVVNLNGIGKATISIKNNVSEMAAKIKSLVESVNLTKAFIKQNTKWGGGKLVSNVLSDGTIERETEGGEENGIMIGNYGFQISMSELDKLMTRAIFTEDDYLNLKFPDKDARAKAGADEKQKRAEGKQTLYEQYLEDNGLLYTRLSDIGIRSDPSQGGTYVVDESRLTECLSKNPEAVIKLFTFANGENDFPVDNRKVVHLDEESRPPLAGFAVQLAYRMSDLTRASDVIDPTTGQVVQSAKGITKVLAENYNNIISGSDGSGGIDGKIAREEKRIQLYQQRLEQKFARLETALAQMNSLAEKVSSQMAQLNNNSSK